jgi:hypothetical protein
MAVSRKGIKMSTDQISKPAKQLQQILDRNKVRLAGIYDDDNEEDNSSDEEDGIPTETEDVRRNLKMLQRMMHDEPLASFHGRNQTCWAATLGEEENTRGTRREDGKTKA